MKKEGECPCRNLIDERRRAIVSADLADPRLVPVPLGCRVDVLDAVTRRAALKAEIWLDEGEQSEPLLSEAVWVQRQNGWASPPATEYRVDFSQLAGREVTLRFRATFRGQAKMGPFDLGGFALVWQDPRVEFR